MIYRCEPAKAFLGYFFPSVAYTERDHYMGLFPLLLAAIGLLSPDHRYKFKKLFIFTIIITIIYSTKSAISHPLQKFLHDFVPLVGSLRSPARSLILNMFCLSILCGYGMDSLTREEPLQQKARRILALIAAIVVTSCIAVLLLPALGVDIPGQTDHYSYILWAAISSMLLGLLAYNGGATKRSLIFPLIAVVLIIADISWATYMKNAGPSAKHHYYTKKDPKIIGAKSLITNYLNENYIHIPPVEQERIGRIDSLIFQPLLFVNSALPSSSPPYNTRGFEGSLLDINRLFIRTRESRRARSIFNTRFDVEYFLPRAYVVYQLKKLPHERIIEEMASPRFDPLNEHYIEEDLPEAFAKLLTEPGESAPNEADRLTQITEETRIVLNENTRIKIETNTPRPGFLYLGEAHYPGWKAFLDGEPAKIYKANYAFRGLPVPEGKHTITFKYRPVRFYTGLLLSITALIVVLVILVSSRRYFEAISIALVCLFCYGPLAAPRTQAETAHARESITAYNMQTVEGKVVSAEPRRSSAIQARVHIEEDGIYDLLVESPPQFYQLNVDKEFAVRIFNTGSESPAPQKNWWEVQAILRLKRGDHEIEFAPIDTHPRMKPVFNKLVPKAGETDMYDIEAIKIDRSIEVRRLKLVKH
jgi:hypothetical protein